ncbi:Divergent_AAA domain-containing protein [Hexamita inflata]|uniref:Divergent AAA domain-containing protein n=1 Tax=Hexamita inflata TaxID=28002 RepID=A0AA86V315_9EUKA|nr:Divergent AAA domain-containing protein [Hexamita inflata]
MGKFIINNNYASVFLLTYSKTQLHYMRICINAFLNSAGGNIFLGLTQDCEPKGVQLTQALKDDIKAAVSIFISSFVPHVEPELVSTDFYLVQQITKSQATYVVQITVLPSKREIIVTSIAHSEAYIFNQKPVNLTADQLIQRFQESRQTCIELETSYKKIDEQSQLVHTALDFIENSLKPTKIVIIQGPSNSGKTYISRRIFDHVEYEHKLQIDFLQYQFVNDIYLELIQQVNPSLKLKLKTNHLKLVPLNETAPTPSSLDELFSQQFISSDEKRCPVLRSVLHNECMNKQVLYFFDSVNTTLNDIVNKGAAGVYIVVCEDAGKLILEEEFAVDIIVLHTQEMNIQQLKQITINKGIQNISDEQLTELINKYGYDVKAIIYNLQTGLELETEQLQASESEFALLKKVCVIPGRFSLKFILNQIKTFENLIMINKFLQKANGFFSMPKQYRIKVIEQLSDDEVRQVSQNVVDFSIAELQILNDKHNFILSKSKVPHFDVQARIMAMEISSFIVNNLKILQTALASSLKYQYKCCELYKEISVFVSNRLPMQTIEMITLIKKENNLMGSTSTSEAE